ncbi:MAG TPA: hypothetical protein VJW95_00825 [Dissulfurispiraceae bacterium]|nr:hypothetical protein [Dissulfurispiraceae bacterium]
MELLKPGAKLAKPIVNDSGMILIGEGVELKDSHIARLQDMCISTVFVEGTTGPSKTTEEMLAELDERFRKTEGEPHMGTVKRIFKEYIEGMSS